MLKEEGYIPEPTASDASFQNGVAERPNRTLADMMRSLLHSAQLGPEYWSWAILHALYLKNRLPHCAISKTPYEAYTGHRPNLKHLHIFGSPLTVRHPGRRPAKLDQHASQGIFLGYTATHKNVYYLDSGTKQIKIGTHVVFDEVGFTLPPNQCTPLQQQLQLHQSKSDTSLLTPQEQDTYQDALDNTMHSTLPQEDPESMYFHRLTPAATIPTRATPDSTGYDLHSTQEITLQPNTTTKVPTDISCQHLLPAFITKRLSLQAWNRGKSWYNRQGLHWKCGCTPSQHLRHTLYCAPRGPHCSTCSVLNCSSDTTRVQQPYGYSTRIGRIWKHRTTFPCQPDSK